MSTTHSPAIPPGIEHPDRTGVPLGECPHFRELEGLQTGAAAAVWACAQGIQFMADPLFVLMSRGIDPLRWFDEVLPGWARATWRQLHAGCVQATWTEESS